MRVYKFGTFLLNQNNRGTKFKRINSDVPGLKNKTGFPKGRLKEKTNARNNKNKVGCSASER